MFCITYDIDGNLVSKEEKPKRWRPRNGFQRGDDGNFYKQLGDPRNISDIEIAEAIKEQQEREERLREETLNKKNKSESVAEAIEEQVRRVKEKCRQGNKTKTKCTQVCRCDPHKRITANELHTNLFWKRMSRSPNDKFITYGEVTIWIKWGVPHIDTIETFERVEVDINKNVIKFWVKHSGPNDTIPDFSLSDGLK